VEFCSNNDVREDHIFYVPVIAKLNAQAAIAAINHTRAENEIAKIAAALCAYLDRTRARDNRAARDGNVLARAILGKVTRVLSDNPIVARLDEAIGNPDIATMVRIDSVTVGHSQIIQDSDIPDEDVIAAQ
jgi:hypothetical protein